MQSKKKTYLSFFKKKLNVNYFAFEKIFLIISLQNAQISENSQYFLEIKLPRMGFVKRASGV